jgi:hypothetical protein
MAGFLTNTTHIGPQQQRRHQVVPRDAGNAVTNIMTQDAHVQMDRMTGASTNKNQHAVERE